MKSLILLVTLSLIAGAFGSEILFQDDFESSIPGKTPKGWRNAWGKVGNDTFAVSGEKSVSGNNSLHYNRTDGENPWQAFLHLPKFKSSHVEISFNFLLLGKANDARYRLMFRKKVSEHQEIDLQLTPNGITGQIAKKPFKVEDSAITPDKWYHISMKFPVEAAENNEMQITLIDLIDKKELKHSAPWRNDKTESGVLILEFSGKSKDTSLFLDDFKISNSAAN